MLKQDNVDIVIFHHPCPDGCTSGTIANMYYKKINKKVEFWGLSHAGNSPPELYDKLKNKNVLICDFSFKKEIIAKILDTAKGLLIIDHHLSAKNELENLDPKYKIFDMDHCGAYLTWKWFFPGEPVPLFVKYIEDNDIWLKAMPNTLEVTSYVTTLDLEFDVYEQYILNESLISTEIIPLGDILLKQSQKQIDYTLKKSTIKMIEYDDKIYFTGICNTTTHFNEIGNTMLTKYPNINFSIVYATNSSNTYQISLRSADDRTDVSVIAAKHSGGGHRNASGCTLYNKIVPGYEIGDFHNYNQLDDVEFSLNENGFNYVILNTTQNKSQFAQYLLQTRTVEKNEGNDKIVQEACSLYRTVNKNTNFYTNFDFSITWHYGGDRTWFCLHWDQNSKSKLDLLFKKLMNFDNYNLIEKKRLIKFSLPKLTLNFFK
jgi:oligoribonuclease NrnB/cAMP/cGMP phosphodiesterase (DHH superfamily)